MSDEDLGSTVLVEVGDDHALGAPADGELEACVELQGEGQREGSARVLPRRRVLGSGALVGGAVGLVAVAPVVVLPASALLGCAGRHEQERDEA